MSENIYSDGNVTTVGNFTTVNITHKPKRMQGDSIKLQLENDNSVTTPHSTPKVPQSVTLEGAIKYYEENAKGDNEKLYKMTVIWLRKLLAMSMKPKIEVTPVETSENTISEIEESLRES